MKLRDIVRRGAVIARVKSSTRDEAITELIDALVASGAASPSVKGELIAAVLDRERKGSTGFGKGVAIPHVKHRDIKGMAAAIGVSPSGIDFNALDKQPVYSVILLLSPASDPDAHLKAMEVIFKHLSQENFRRFLRQATSEDEIWTLLEDADNQTLGS